MKGSLTFTASPPTPPAPPALSLAPATVVVPLDFARLPLIAVVGMLLYQEPLDVFVFLGALFIFGGNYLNIWTETHAGRSRV